MEGKGLQDCCKTLKMGIYNTAKTLRLPTILLVEHGVVVMTVSFHSGKFQFETYVEPIFNPRFKQFVFRINGVIKL